MATSAPRWAALTMAVAMAMVLLLVPASGASSVVGSNKPKGWGAVFGGSPTGGQSTAIGQAIAAGALSEEYAVAGVFHGTMDLDLSAGGTKTLQTTVPDGMTVHYGEMFVGTASEGGKFGWALQSETTSGLGFTVTDIAYGSDASPDSFMVVSGLLQGEASFGGLNLGGSADGSSPFIVILSTSGEPLEAELFTASNRITMPPVMTVANGKGEISMAVTVPPVTNVTIGANNFLCESTTSNCVVIATRKYPGGGWSMVNMIPEGDATMVPTDIGTGEKLFVVGSMTGCYTIDTVELCTVVIEGNYQPSMFVVEYVNGKYGGGSVFANGALGALQKTAVALQGASMLFITGSFENTIMFGDISLHARGGEDVYLVAMDQELYPLWATNIGSSESDESGGAAVDIYGAGVVVSGRVLGHAFEGNRSLNISDTEYLAYYDISGKMEWLTEVQGSLIPGDLVCSEENLVVATGGFTDIIRFPFTSSDQTTTTISAYIFGFPPFPPQPSTTIFPFTTPTPSPFSPTSHSAWAIIIPILLLLVLAVGIGAYFYRRLYGKGRSYTDLTTGSNALPIRGSNAGPSEYGYGAVGERQNDAQYKL